MFEMKWLEFSKRAICDLFASNDDEDDSDDDNAVI